MISIVHEHVDTSLAIVEGISNLTLLLVSVCILVLCFAILYKIRPPGIVIIHPNHVQQVEATRERVLYSRESVSEEHMNNAIGQRRTRDDTCPICLDNLQYSVETNCGHVFCCPCIVSYWEHGNWVSAMNCPVCRQEVRVLLGMFVHEEEVSDDGVVYRNKVHAYNRRFSGEPRPIWDYILDFPVIARHMFRNFFSVSGLVYMLRIRILLYLSLVLLYILSPFDIIPEAMAGVLGLLDDVAVASVIILYLTIIFRQSLANLN